MITEDHASWVSLGADYFKFVQCKHMQLSEKEKQDIRARLARYVEHDAASVNCKCHDCLLSIESVAPRKKFRGYICVVRLCGKRRLV